MKLQIEKGLFRLWIVFSAIWISVTLIKEWNNYTETRDTYIKAWDEHIKAAPQLEDLEILEEEKDAPKKIYTAEDFMPMSKEDCIQYKKDLLANWKTANIESIPNTLGLAFGIPLLLLIPYYILKWIALGFVGKKS